MMEVLHHQNCSALLVLGVARSFSHSLNSSDIDNIVCYYFLKRIQIFLNTSAICARRS